MIIKLSKSGNAITIIDDFGNTYGTSKTYLMALVSGRMKAPFIEVNRYPMPADLDRFRPSPVLGKDYEAIPPDDERWTPPQCSHNIQTGSAHKDGISVYTAKKKEETKMFSDKKIDW